MLSECAYSPFGRTAEQKDTQSYLWEMWETRFPQIL